MLHSLLDLEIKLSICLSITEPAHGFFGCVWSLFCNTVLSVPSSFEIILLRKRAGCFTLIVLLLSCGCYWHVSLFLVVPWVGLHCVTVAFPGQTHQFFFFFFFFGGGGW